MSIPKQLIIGIDGATYDLIDPWVKAGHLPNLGRLMESGTSAEMTTSVPPLTGPAWCSFMTGCNPGKHGVYDFLKPDPRNEEIIDFDSIQVPTLWELLSQGDRSVGAVNVPVTFPPPDVKGKIISGTLSSSDPESAARPSGLIEDLESRTGRTWWRRDWEGYTPSKPLQFLQAMTRCNETMSEFSKELLRTNDFDTFMVLFDLVDGISHFFWHYMAKDHPLHEDRGSEFENAVLEAYRMVDQWTGELIEVVPDQTDVVLVSDHGFGPIEKMVNLNNFLMDKGYLSLRSSPMSLLKQAVRGLGVTPRRVMKMVELFGLDFLVFMVPKSVRNKIIGGMGSYEDVDWEETVCYSRGHMGQIHFTDDVKKDPDRYERLRDEVSQALTEELRDPETGETFVSEVHYKEDLYEGPFLEDAPDLFLVMDDFNYISYPLFSGGQDLVMPHIQDNRYANHRMNGIFCGSGPSFADNGRIEDCKITDVVPTMLYLSELEVPSYLDGEVLLRALKEDVVDSKPLRESDVDVRSLLDREDGSGPGSDEEARERLEGLGYLG